MFERLMLRLGWVPVVTMMAAVEEVAQAEALERAHRREAVRVSNENGYRAYRAEADLEGERRVVAALFGELLEVRRG